MDFWGDMKEAVGLAAGFLTTFSFLPQVLKSWKTKSVKDFSWLLLGMFSLGVFLWLIYGILISSLSVIAANSITLIFVLVLIGLKAKYG